MLGKRLPPPPKPLPPPTPPPVSAHHAATMVLFLKANTIGCTGRRGRVRKGSSYI